MKTSRLDIHKLRLLLLRALLALLVCLVSLGASRPEESRATRAGILDPSFGDQGRVSLDFNGGWASAAVIGIDGKILAAGYSPGSSSQNDFALVRYTFDGQLDTSFGRMGQITTDFNGQDDQASAIAVQAGGKILVAGKTVPFSDPVLPDTDFALARYTPKGGLDRTFGLGGRVTLDFGASDGIAALALLPDGKILAAGDSLQYEFGQIVLARLNPNGSLDAGFGQGGKVFTQIDQGAAEVSALLLQPDGKLLVAGQVQFRLTPQNGAFVARYLPEGSPDPSFGEDGIALLVDRGLSDRIQAIALQPDGRIVAAGTNSDQRQKNLLLVRFEPDGSLDAGFGDSGKIVTDLGNASEQAHGVQVQSDGKLVVAGHIGQPVSLDIDFLLARYLPDGSLDPSFGVDGISRVDFGADDYGYALAMYGDGRILLAGKTGVNHYDFALARLQNDVPHLLPKVWIPMISH
jgi:uncharacterized delta-60 repeat protein